MQKTCKITILNEVFSNISGLDATTKKKCIDKLKFLVPWRFHTPSYKLGRWDGSIKFLHENGRVYTNLLQDIIPIIMQNGYEFEFEDRRTIPKINVPKITKNLFDGRVWPEGHRFAGQPIELREDQVEAANIFADNRYAVQELSTGYGKCLGYDTLVPVFTIEEDLANLLNIAPNCKQEVKIGLLYDILRENDVNYHPNKVDKEIYAYTPEGVKTKISYVIRKLEPSLRFHFENGQYIDCADEHIFMYKRQPIRALDITLEHAIDTVRGYIKFVKVESLDKQNVYDITVEEPHWYVDSMDIIHHNTILTAAICKQVEHLGRTLTIVPNKSLVTQTFKTFDDVGLNASMYFSEHKDVTAHHVITTWQSLETLNKSKESKVQSKSDTAMLTLEAIKDNLVQIIVDECHGAKSSVLDTLLSGEFSNIPLRRGFTGTLPTEEFERKTIIGNIGELVNQVKARDLQEEGFLADCNIHCLRLDDSRVYESYHDEYGYLVENTKRLDRVIEMIEEISKDGNTLILVDRITGAEYMNSKLENSEIVHGTVKLKERDKIYDLASKNDNVKIIATYGVAAVGIDIPRLYNVVLLEPGKSAIRIIQSIGRGLRLAKDKNHVDIWDLYSDSKFSKKHAKERMKIYSNADYPYEDFGGNDSEILKYIGNKLEKKS